MKSHLFMFSNEAAAMADSIVGPYHNPGSAWEGVAPFWDQSMTFPNTNVWLNAVKQSGFWIIICSPNVNTQLAQHSSCRLAWDPDNAVILGGTWTGNEMAQLHVEPTPMGSYNPWNGPSPF